MNQNLIHIVRQSLSYFCSCRGLEPNARVFAPFGSLILPIKQQQQYTVTLAPTLRGLFSFPHGANGDELRYQRQKLVSVEEDSMENEQSPLCIVLEICLQ